MPNIKSQIKRVKTNNKAKISNNSKRNQLKTALKKYDIAIAEGDVAKCEAMLNDLVSFIYKLAAEHIYPMNTAARKVSSAYAKFNALKASAKA